MKKEHKKEKGMALLFTLGILALLLVLAMAFASTARIGRKAASNNAELTCARFLAESALQRAMGAMRFYRETGGNQYDNIISHDASGGTNQKTYDGLYHLETTLDGAEIFKWPTPYDPDAADAIHWQYVDNGRTGSELRLIGRIAYKVFGSGGKIDPSAAIRHTAVMLGVPAGTAVAESPATEVRNGNWVYEINIQNLTRTDATNLPSSDVLMLSSDLVAGGTLNDSERWSDWGTLFSLLGISTTTKKEKWKTWFDIERPADTESFWVDSDGDGIETPSELYHRFNLAREETNAEYPANEPNNPGWSQLTVDDILSDPVEYSAGDGKYYGKSIKWLKDNTNLPTDTFSSAQTKAKQIAANLIDYCDNNRSATTDSTTAPTYTGNDESPYINEIRIQIDGDVVEAPAGTYNLGLTLTADAEVINIYNTTDNKQFNVDVVLTVSGEYYWGPKNSATPATFTDMPITINISPVGNRCYATGTSTSNDISEGVWTGAPGLGKKINNVKITKLNAKLVDHDTGEFYDFAYVETASGQYDVKTNDSDNDRYYFLDYAVNDPRQNLNEGDWTLTVSKKTANGSLGSKNTVCNPNPGGNKDVETGAVEPWNVSTAYIRNSYMRSPWEIGFIHRAAAWETLRIYLYNRNDDNDGTNNEAGEWGVSPNMGISSWQWGDANILDQIKMSGATECFGKVNVNSTNDNVLMALIGGIRVGGVAGSLLPNASRTTSDGTDDSEPGALSYGSELVYAGTDDVNYIAIASTNSIKVPGASAAAGTAYLPFKTRAQVATTTTQAFSSGVRFTQTTDALKEEVIGKFINLTKATPDTITIIVIAQTFKDLGGVTVKKDLDDDGDTDGNVTENGVDIDGKDSNNDGNYANDALPAGCETIDTQYGRYDQYAEEILSEQKIIATVIYDQTTQKWRILKYEYLE